MSNTMNIAILGLGKSGISAVRFLKNSGHNLWVTDDTKTSCDLDGVRFVLPDELPVEKMAYIVISPGLKLSHPVLQKAKKLGVPFFCDVELAFRQVVTRPQAVVGITGSNGKTTTTLLCEHMLGASKRKALSCGNVGRPILDVITLQDTALIVELSSFQLQTITTPILSAGCLLNIYPNHLNYHESFDAYALCKWHLAALLKKDCPFYVHERFAAHARDHVHSFGFGPDSTIYTDAESVYRYGKKEASLPKALQGKKTFEVENFLAAYALARDLGANAQDCIESYETFEKPPHRLQFVREIEGIHFYNDSKATNVEATCRALESFSTQVVLLAGGVHKGSDYTSWRKAFENKVRACVVFGEAQDTIAQDLQDVVPIQKAETFEMAIQHAYALAKKGDSVLLSPGCSSFDMFTSFEERGNKFRDFVTSL